MTYDWSTRRDDDDHASIRWAAFYSDCEHEILEVTSGYRLTLTYNLYAVRGMDRLTGISKSLDPTLLPLYQAVESIMGAENGHFDGKGGLLCLICLKARYLEYIMLTRNNSWHVGILVYPRLCIQPLNHPPS